MSQIKGKRNKKQRKHENEEKLQNIEKKIQIRNKMTYENKNQIAHSGKQYGTKYEKNTNQKLQTILHYSELVEKSI